MADKEEHFQSEILPQLKDMSRREEIELDELRDRYKDHVSEAEEHYDELALEMDPHGPLDDALSTLHSEIYEAKSVPTERVSVCAIGSRRRQWDDKDHPNYDEDIEKSERPKKDVIIASALVKPEDQPKGLASVIIDSKEDDVDAYQLRDYFEPLNAFSGEFTVNESTVADAYRLDVRQDPDIDDDVSSTVFPEERVERWKEVREFTDATKVRTMRGNISKTETRDDGREFSADFGVDVKRIEKANVISAHKDEEDDFAVFNIIDDSIVDREELIEAGIISDEGDNRDNGVTVWTDPESLTFGEGSVIELYGVIQEGERGYSIDYRGAIPRKKQEYTENSGEEEEESSENVDSHDL